MLDEVVERLRIEEQERVAKKSKSKVPKAKSVQAELFNTENKENESTSESSDQEEDDMKYTVCNHLSSSYIQRKEVR